MTVIALFFFGDPAAYGPSVARLCAYNVIYYCGILSTLHRMGSRLDSLPALWIGGRSAGSGKLVDKSFTSCLHADLLGETWQEIKSMTVIGIAFFFLLPNFTKQALLWQLCNIS